MYSREHVIDGIKIALDAINVFFQRLPLPLRENFTKIFPHTAERTDKVQEIVENASRLVTLKNTTDAWLEDAVFTLEEFEAFSKSLQHQLLPESTALYLSVRSWPAVEQSQKKDSVKKIKQYVKANKIQNHVIVNRENGRIGILADLNSNTRLRDDERFTPLTNINACPGLAELSRAITKTNNAIATARNIFRNNPDKIVEKAIRSKRKMTFAPAKLRIDNAPSAPAASKIGGLPPALQRPEEDEPPRFDAPVRPLIKLKKPTPLKPLEPIVKKKRVPKAKVMVEQPVVEQPVVEQPVVEQPIEILSLNPFDVIAPPPSDLPPAIKREDVEVDVPASDLPRDTNPFSPANLSNPSAAPAVAPVATIDVPKLPSEMNDQELRDAIIKKWEDLNQADPAKMTANEKIEFLIETDHSRLRKHKKFILDRKADKNPKNDSTITRIENFYKININPKREVIITEHLLAFEQEWTEKFSPNFNFFNLDALTLNKILRDLENGIQPFKNEYRNDKEHLSKYLTAKANTPRDEAILNTISKIEQMNATFIEELDSIKLKIKTAIVSKVKLLSQKIKEYNDDYLGRAITTLPNIDVLNDIDLINNVNVSADKQQIKKIIEMDSDAVIDQLIMQLENDELGYKVNLEEYQTMTDGVDFSKTVIKAKNGEEISLNKTFAEIQGLFDRIKMREILEQKIDENKQQALAWEEKLLVIEKVQAVYNKRKEVLEKIAAEDKKEVTNVNSVGRSSTLSWQQTKSISDQTVKQYLIDEELLNERMIAINHHIKLLQNDILPRLNRLGTFEAYLHSNNELAQELVRYGIDIANQASIAAQDKDIANAIAHYNNEITSGERALEGYRVELANTNRRLATAEERCLENGIYDSVCGTIFRGALHHIQTSPNYLYLFDHARSKGDSKAFQIASYLNSIMNAKSLAQLITSIQSDPEDPETHKKMRRVRGFGSSLFKDSTFYKNKISTTDAKAKLLAQELIEYLRSTYEVDITQAVENAHQVSQGRGSDTASQPPKKK